MEKSTWYAFWPQIAPAPIQQASTKMEIDDLLFFWMMNTLFEVGMYV